MGRLVRAKLHVTYLAGAAPTTPVMPRRYTLTHSDATGDLFLSIGLEYNQAERSGWYARLLRDEVLAEWLNQESGAALHVFCHVSGGFVVGTARWRYAIFQRELPLVLEALRFGDQELYKAWPDLDNAPIRVHFRAKQRRYDRIENWGTPADYWLG